MMPGPPLAFHPPNISLQPRCESSPPSNTEPPPARRPHSPKSTRPSAVVVLMRHGMTDWNLAGRVQGGLDKSRLNHIGTRQAQNAGRCLRNLPIDAVFCSPLSRARDTLKIASAASQNRALQSRRPEIIEELIEIQVPWQGLQKRDIPNSIFSEAYGQYSRNPPRFSWNGYSPLRDIVRRATSVWETVVRANGACQLLVSHNQMNKALICTALGMPTVLSAWRQSNCCFNVFMLEDGKDARLRLCNGCEQTMEGSLARRRRVRHGCMRIVLHQLGNLESLQQEVNGMLVASHYLVGGTCSEEYEKLHGDEPGKGVFRNLDFREGTDAEMYEAARNALDGMRQLHAEQYLVLGCRNSITLRAFFAASIGMGAEGMRKLISDPGGVSVLDVRVKEPVGTAITYVERYNVGAWLEPDPLFGYSISHAVPSSQEQF